MVSFIADPRIAQSQAQRQAMLAEALTPYQLPRNPYGGSPVAGNLQRLAAALGARWAGQDANRLQKQQQAAQAAVLSRVSELSRAQPGPFYETIQTPVSGIDSRPGAVQTQIQRIADDGSVLPPEISAETARTAGIDPLTLKALMDDAKRTGKVATQEAIKIEALKGLQQAVSDLTMAEERGTPEEQASARNMVAQWRAITDPSAAFGDIQAQNQLEARIERDLEKEERGEIQRWTRDGQPIWLTKRVWRADQKRPKSEQLYTNVEPEKEEKPSAWKANLDSLLDAGIDRDSALDIAHKRFKVITDAQGYQVLFNIRTREVIRLEDLPSVAQEIVVGQGESENIPIEKLTDKGYWERILPIFSAPRYQDSSIWSRFSQTMEPVTGFLSEVLGGLESTAGQIPGLEGAFESGEVTQMKTAFNQVAMQIVKAFQNNPKYAEGERKAIAEELNITPDIWSNPERLRNRLIQTARSLTRRLRREEEFAADPIQSKENRQAAARTASVIKYALVELGVPEYGGWGVLTISPESATVEQLSDSTKVPNQDLLKSLFGTQPEGLR
jgi:hypothetical protein